MGQGANMDLREEQKAVGREGLVWSNGVEISVIIRDVRLKPHAVDYLAEPTAGRGKTWINGDQVRIVSWPG